MRDSVELELSLVSNPQHVLEVGSGSVLAVPAVGDYVSREDSGWYGYVKSRRWTFTKRGGVIVRCWLQEHPP